MFRFTIRDLLWLMVVVGMGVAWYLDHKRITPSEWEFLNKSKEAGYEFSMKSGQINMMKKK